MSAGGPSPEPAPPNAIEERHPLLDAFGDRLRTLRAQRGLTRRALAQTAAVSERYLVNLEAGRGNPSLLILHEIARALDCSVAQLLGDVSATSPEWALIRELLQGRGEEDLRRARLAVGEALGTGGDRRSANRRIALIGLRGAGKSTLGQMLAEYLDVPFIELSAEIQRIAGIGIPEIHNLYGPGAYRKYERRALEDVLQIYPEVVLATPGGLVTDPAAFNLLLSHCTTVWLQAAPEAHMSRVIGQGDTRPMAGNDEAMADLRRILDARSAFYGRADITLDTSAQALDGTLGLLCKLVHERTETPRS
ncbi:helix-turn-helix transcriptional regulator [Ramlibacter sp. WS9]|uniref:helix-turn-helix transcriptional regulator n=1 Tax=Ramlibacter sp. WS9 TaxID=1882741 RepID=UPI001E482042|nr:helix-turn-helix transcriptional regulator [Ramlibacter sp. WS9]